MDVIGIKNLESFGPCYLADLLPPKEPIPKIRNKYSQERNCAATSPKFPIHVSVSNLYITTIGLPLLLQEICVPILGIYNLLIDTGMWTLGLRPRNSQKRLNK